MRWNYSRSLLIVAGAILAVRLLIGWSTGDHKQLSIGLNVVLFGLLVGFIADLVASQRERGPVRREGPQPPPRHR